MFETRKMMEVEAENIIDRENTTSGRNEGSRLGERECWQNIEKCLRTLRKRYNKLNFFWSYIEMYGVLGLRLYW